MRLDKFLAQAGVGKRKEVRGFIEDGKVKVNGKIECIPAIEIDEITDEIYYLEQLIKGKEQVYYMLNKPKGYVTATRDKEHKTVFDLFNEDMAGVFHIGRLDIDTEGMLLFTNDGEFEHKIMYPDKHIEKTYFFVALGSLDSEDCKAIEKGIYIENGKTLAKPGKLKIEKNGFEEYFKDYISFDKLNERYKRKMVSGYLTISEGRKHQVKKMIKALGGKVLYLRRDSIGGLSLFKDLKSGEYRKLSEKEVKIIFEE